jgi:FkbM family methyltransferase
MNKKTGGKMKRNKHTQIFQRQRARKNTEKAGMRWIDSEFEKLIGLIRTSDKNDLFETLKLKFHTWMDKAGPQKRDFYFNWMGKFSFWGSIDPGKGDYTLIKNRADTLKDHAEDFVWLYRRLTDYRSKCVLYRLLDYWLLSAPEQLAQVREARFKPYFDLDLIRGSAQEVFVDLGGFVGDTVQAYIETYGSDCYKKIYTYEILERNLYKMRDNLKEYAGVEICARGVGEKACVMYLDNSKKAVDAACLGENGEQAIPVVALDEDIKEPITYLKMDIEGGEYAALKGAAEHIRTDKPKLAVSLYHSNDDLWRLPKLIDSIMPAYDFYLRYYGSTLIVADYVLYCLPSAPVPPMEKMKVARLPYGREKP